MSSSERDVMEAFAELEKRDNTFHIKWSFLNKRYLITIPWLDEEYDGKTLAEALAATLKGKEEK